MKRGAWQIPVFGLALFLVLVVWGLFPEPEESKRGYTRRGCYRKATLFFQNAKRLAGPAYLYPRTGQYASAAKYLEALEERFGVPDYMWDAYEMLGDSEAALASAAETTPDLSRQMRLDPPDELRRRALRAYRGALLRIRREDADRLRLLRKEAEALLSLARPADALEILRDLVKNHRKGEVERLREERAGTAPEAARRVRAGEEALNVYFLAGEGALAAGLGEEAEGYFRMFLEGGGSGARRVSAEMSLGDLSFERAGKPEAQGDGRLTETRLRESLSHYASAGTEEAAFRMGKALFKLNAFEGARRYFTPRDWHTAAEKRKRRYMDARCLLELSQLEEAAKAFGLLRADNPDDREGFLSLLALARLAEAFGRLERAAELLLGAAGRVEAGARGALDEIDLREQGRAEIAGRLFRLAEGFEKKRDAERAVELYRAVARTAEAARGPDPALRCAALRRIARVWEKSGLPDAAVRAACGYLELARAVGDESARRRALGLAIERFQEGRRFSRAAALAEGYLSDYPDSPSATRVRYELGRMKAALGFVEEAECAFEGNIERCPDDYYTDLSRLALAEAWGASDRREELEEARALALGIITDARHAAGTLVRLKALFLAGRLDVELAELTADEARRVELFSEAIRLLDEALGGEYRANMPLFRALVKERRAGALLLKGRALLGLGRPAGALLALVEISDAAAGEEADVLASCARALLGGELDKLEKTAAALRGRSGALGLFTSLAFARLAAGDAKAAARAARRATQAGEGPAEQGAGCVLLGPEFWRSWSRWVAGSGGGRSVNRGL